MPAQQEDTKTSMLQWVEGVLQCPLEDGGKSHGEVHENLSSHDACCMHRVRRSLHRRHRRLQSLWEREHVDRK